MPTISLPLRKMSFSQKMEVLERVWDSLSSDQAKFKSPAWHKDVLEERAKRVKSGKAKFSDWAEAKERIRGRVRAA